MERESARLEQKKATSELEENSFSISCGTPTS